MKLITTIANTASQIRCAVVRSEAASSAHRDGTPECDTHRRLQKGCAAGLRADRAQDREPGE